MEGKIIVTIFPQDKQKKLRPSLALPEFPKYGDVLVCGITSQIHQYIPALDLLLDKDHPDFKNTGLKFPGVRRLNMLTMIPISNINGTIGQISASTHRSLLQSLADYLVYK